MELLAELIPPLLELMPEVIPPPQNSKAALTIQDRLKWTAAILVIYLMMSQVRQDYQKLIHCLYNSDRHKFNQS